MFILNIKNLQTRMPPVSPRDPAMHLVFFFFAAPCIRVEQSAPKRDIKIEIIPNNTPRHMKARDKISSVGDPRISLS